MYYGPILHTQFFKIRHAASPKHRSLYCGPLTQTAVFQHRFRSRCRGTDRETGSKASIWSGLCVVNIHFWCLCEEKSHIPYFKTKPPEKRGYHQKKTPQVQWFLILWLTHMVCLFLQTTEMVFKSFENVSFILWNMKMIFKYSKMVLKISQSFPCFIRIYKMIPNF